MSLDHQSEPVGRYTRVPLGQEQLYVTLLQNTS